MRLAALFAVVTTLLVLGAPAAFAGGPTSVILVNPQTGATAALYNSSIDYQALNDALGEAPQQPVPGTPDLHGGPGSSAFNITWLMHDVQVWRSDPVLTQDAARPVSRD